jgi:hypothetical protein
MIPKILSTIVSGILLIAILLACSGCGNIFKAKIEPHPDSPILITRTCGGFVKGAVYDRERNAMIPAGWFWIGRYDGWTLHKFDWNSRIEKEKQTKVITKMKE